MSAAAKPVRLTPTQRLHEVTMQALSRKPVEPTSDVEISRSSVNGRYGFKVAVTAADPHDAERLATEIVARLDALYPVQNGTGSPEKPSEAPGKVRSRGKP